MPFTRVLIDYRGVLMFNEQDKDLIIVEIRELIESTDDFQADMDAYCAFMLQSILNVSGMN